MENPTDREKGGVQLSNPTAHEPTHIPHTTLRRPRQAVVRKWKVAVPLLAMLAPTLVYFLVFAYYPLAHSVVISLQQYSLIGARPFVGLANFRAALTDPNFWRDFLNTLILGAGILSIGFVAPIMIALSLNVIMSQWIRRTLQMFVYLPSLFSWVVVGGLWIELLKPDGGLVNLVVHALGFRSIAFMTSAALARWVIILVAVWKDAGFSAVIYLAALAGINPSLYEAARIDGANYWHEVRYVTLPSLVGTMRVVLLLAIMGVLSMFDEIYVMRNAVTAPQVNVAMMYVYDHGFELFNLGEATASALLILAATLLLTIATRRLVRYDL